jgi:hypothetical protein
MDANQPPGNAPAGDLRVIQAYRSGLPAGDVAVLARRVVAISNDWCELSSTQVIATSGSDFTPQSAQPTARPTAAIDDQAHTEARANERRAGDQIQDEREGQPEDHQPDRGPVALPLSHRYG